MSVVQAIYRTLLGSVSEGVLHHASCPVLIVPVKDRGISDVRASEASDASSIAGTASAERSKHE